MPYGSRDARQAAAGLSHVTQTELLRPGPDVRLGEPRVDQGERRAALGGRALARPMVAEVVEVDAEDDRGAALGGQRASRDHQRVLAPVAAIAVVARVVGVVELVGGRPPASAAPSSSASAAHSSRSAAGSDGETAVTASGPVGPEGVVRHPRQEGGVGAAGEGHDDRAELPQALAQGLERGVRHRRPRGGCACCPCPSTRSSRPGCARPRRRADVRAAVGLLVEPDDVDDADLGHGLGDQAHLGADEVLVERRRPTGAGTTPRSGGRPRSSALTSSSIGGRSPRAAGRTRSPCGPTTAPCSRR